MADVRLSRRTLPVVLHSLRTTPRLSRRHLLPCCRRRGWCRSRSYSQRHPTFAFCFDIDGVLLRSSSPIPGATKTLERLQERGIPFLLLTNGGGFTEAKRIRTLEEELRFPLQDHMFVQSHTPYKDFVSSGGVAANDAILVVGGEGNSCREAAEGYGFKNVIVSADIYADSPAVWPFSAPLKDYYARFARPLPRPIYRGDGSAPSLPRSLEEDFLRIAAIFVYNDTRDWGLDAQIMLDLLLSRNGVLGTRSPSNGRRADRPDRGYQSDGQPPLHFANPDLLFAARWNLPRLGSGGFRAAFEGLWRAVTSADGGPPVELKYRLGGKPHASSYAFAEKILHERAALGGRAARLKTVYMVGDNPASDILGANTFRSSEGVNWESILVRTGVFEGEAPPGPGFVPKHIAKDVWQAVQWAIEKEEQ